MNTSKPFPFADQPFRAQGDFKRYPMVWLKQICDGGQAARNVRRHARHNLLGGFGAVILRDLRQAGPLHSAQSVTKKQQFCAAISREFERPIISSNGSLQIISPAKSVFRRPEKHCLRPLQSMPKLECAKKKLEALRAKICPGTDGDIHCGQDATRGRGAFEMSDFYAGPAGFFLCYAFLTLR